LRRITQNLLPGGIVEAPKRPLQTPQREWLRGPLRGWATDWIEVALNRFGGQWLDPQVVRKTWQRYCDGIGDNSFFIWQWINLGMMTKLLRRPAPASGVPHGPRP
jgi:asparagine synthase (glutamine-hydrolysing)